MVGTENEIPHVRNKQGDQQKQIEEFQEWSIFHFTFPVERLPKAQRRLM
jgi:hypothetical protein